MEFASGDVFWVNGKYVGHELKFELRGKGSDFPLIWKGTEKPLQQLSRKGFVARGGLEPPTSGL